MAVKLSDVASELTLATDEMTCYLHKGTGEMVHVADDDLRAVEEGIMTTWSGRTRI